MESSKGKEIYKKTKDSACFKSQVTSAKASFEVELNSHQLKIATEVVQ